MTEQSPPQYARRLGAFDASMIVVGGIIGGGIFLNPRYVAQQTGSNTELIVAWIVGGVLALGGALCYAELGARRPQAGGGYVYLREAFGPLVAFLYGWIMLSLNYSGSIAAVATTFATYTCVAFNIDPRFIQPLAVGAIVLLTAINILGVRPGANVQNVFTVLKLLALAALTVTGLFFIGPAQAPGAITSVPPPPSGLAFGAMLMPVLFSYSGWGYVNNIGAEIRAPQRNMPRALFGGMLLAMIAYVLANLAYVNALGHAGLAASKAPATDVMQLAFGDIGAKAIALGIAISTFGYCNIAILGGARVFQVMGQDGVFFTSAARIHPRFRTPDIALMLLSGWAVALALSGTYNELLNYSTFGDWFGYLLVVATLFWFRRRGSDGEVFLAPGYPWMPVLFMLAVVLILTSYVGSNQKEALIGVGMIAAGVPIYFLWTRWLRRRSA